MAAVRNFCYIIFENTTKTAHIHQTPAHRLISTFSSNVPTKMEGCGSRIMTNACYILYWLHNNP